jgi:c-di-GMP-binding flagellar brake protein YcgR
MRSAKPKPDYSRQKPSDLRRFRRVRISLAGRYMLEDKREFECRTVDISAGGMALVAPVLPSAGERIVVYLDHLGRLDGVVIRIVADGFAISFQSSQKKRERLTDQLTWLVNRTQLGVAESRSDTRIVPKSRVTQITLADGSSFPAYLVDISRSGAAVQTEARPEIGTVVTIGKLRAHAVRHFETGLALQFVRPIPIELFDDDYEL